MGVFFKFFKTMGTAKKIFFFLVGKLEGGVSASTFIPQTGSIGSFFIFIPQAKILILALKKLLATKRKNSLKKLGGQSEIQD